MSRNWRKGSQVGNTIELDVCSNKWLRKKVHKGFSHTLMLFQRRKLKYKKAGILHACRRKGRDWQIGLGDSSVLFWKVWVITVRSRSRTQTKRILAIREETGFGRQCFYTRGKDFFKWQEKMTLKSYMKRCQVLISRTISSQLLRAKNTPNIKRHFVKEGEKRKWEIKGKYEI